MKLQNSLALLFILFSFYANAQDMAAYTNNWEGKIENPKTFNFTVEINIGLKASFKIYNERTIIDHPFKVSNLQQMKIPFSENLFFEGMLSADKKEINGFIKSGILLYHLKLTRKKDDLYVGNWNILMVDELKSQNFFLSIENGTQEAYEAYPVWGDNRFTGTWCGNFQKDQTVISFSDFKTGLKFKGNLSEATIALGVFLDNYLITEIELKKSETDWKIGGFKTTYKTGILQLDRLEHLISQDSLPNTHAVLISKNGKLIYENYFDGYTKNVLHDMRSASKSISSAIVGIAKDQSLFESVDQSIFDFLPAKYQILKDSLKAKISIRSLLTMSSGLDAVDYGINANPKSSAVEENYQKTEDWIKSILTAPMINSPNTKANYGSANPYLLGIAMDSVVKVPLELFMDQNLFQKIGISNYIIQTDLNGNPYFGGGMYLTPDQMLKFGGLYLNDGKWNGKQILSKTWINHSFKNYRILENTTDKNGYGYLWWHNSYTVDGKNIESIEARGAGGQYIFVLPALKAVVAITAGNFRNGKTQQPEMILKNYILPYLKIKR